MIVLDTSALIAVVNHEPERELFLEIIATSDQCLISALTILETSMVTLSRFGPIGLERLAEWLSSFAPEIAPFDEAQAQAALQAFRKYGKGVDPKARLNLGDCAAYALAKTRDAPLLFKGNDFSATDIHAAASGTAGRSPTA